MSNSTWSDDDDYYEDDSSNYTSYGTNIKTNASSTPSGTYSSKSPAPKSSYNRWPNSPTNSSYSFRSDYPKTSPPLPTPSAWSSYYSRPDSPVKASSSMKHSVESSVPQILYDKSSESPAYPLVHEPLLTKQETQGRILYWKDEARTGGFNADIDIVDPVAFEAHLDHTEESVVTSSEFFRCRGSYRCNDNTLPDLSLRENWLPNMAEALYFKTPGYFSKNNPTTATNLLGWSKEVLESLWKSYIILCRTMMIFDRLQRNDFCTTFYSMLAGQSRTRVAQLIRINQADLEGLKTGLENAIIKFYDRDSEDGPGFILTTFVATQCDLVFGSMTLLPHDAWMTQNSTVTLCRMTVLLLDLAMVSYVGSHGTPFFSYIGSVFEGIEIHSDTPDIPSFQCSLQPLACLSDFLDDKKVWVFQPIEEHSSDPQWRGISRGISVLTRMEEFSDVWGPVWPVRSSSSNRIRQYNLSRGFIRPIPRGSMNSEHGVQCHWYSSSFISQPGAPDDIEGELTLGMDDLLSIGGALHENNECGYTREHFENNYGPSMQFLGTVSDSWRLDTRTFGMAAGQWFTLNASGTQKRLPGITLKEKIYNNLSQSPQNANPEFLNLFVGLEISHCTGNARRIRFKDLLRLKSVRHRLNQNHPDWDQTHWGQLFLRALEDEDPNAVYCFWRDHRDVREDVGRLLTPMLQLLHLTGQMGNTLVAAYFAEFADRHLEMESRGNEWGICLRDSRGMATYAVIGDKCLRNSRTRSVTCSRRLNETMYETGIEFDGDLPVEGDSIQLNPGGNFFLARKVRGNRITLVPRTGQTAARILHPIIITALEIVGKIGAGRRFFSALIKASTRSYGGMSRPRQEIQPQVTIHRIQEVLQPQTITAQPLPRLTYDQRPSPSQQPQEVSTPTILPTAGSDNLPLQVQQAQRPRDRRRKKKKKQTQTPQACCVML